MARRCWRADFFIGLVVPPLAALLRPLLSTFVFLLTAATMVELTGAGSRTISAGRVALALIIAWTMVATPVLMAAAVGSLSRRRRSPRG